MYRSEFIGVGEGQLIWISIYWGGAPLSLIFSTQYSDLPTLLTIMHEEANYEYTRYINLLTYVMIRLL